MGVRLKKVKQLQEFIDYLDYHTKDGLAALGPGWGDDEFLDQESSNLIAKLQTDDWLK